MKIPKPNKTIIYRKGVATTRVIVLIDLMIIGFVVWMVWYTVTHP